jgi:hypothetical protein
MAGIERLAVDSRGYRAEEQTTIPFLAVPACGEEMRR